MRLPLFRGLTLISCLLAGNADAQVASLKNKTTRLDFDLKTGSYSLFTGGSTAISKAYATVEGWSSADPACQRKITSRSRNQLSIECARPDAPTMLLEFTLYPSFLELRAGIKNATAAPIRIKKFEPLTGGMIFPGGEWTEVRTLNAPSGANQTRVIHDAVRSSANDLLLTFRQSGVRRSLVLGALKTADFTKWAHTRSGWSQPERLGLRRVGYLDCGGAGTDASPFRVVRGRPFSWDGSPDQAGSVLFDEKAVEFEVAKLDPKKRYVLGFTWWDKDANGRVQSVLVNGQPLVAKRAVPTESATELLALPTESYRDGRLSLAFTNDANVPNAVVSELWLWEAEAGVEWPSGSAADRVTAALEAYDPVGKLVEPGETYFPADSFYVDAGTANPFEALEKYGLALREATGAKPNPYDFPTVCAWYAGVWKTPGAQNGPQNSAYKINTSSGLVEEAQKMKASGFLNYSRAAGRLVPDNYTRQNAQGWWDDAHYQQHGFYTAPYETSAKMGAGMHGNGVLAFTYIQPVVQPPHFGNRISLDFRESHRDWLLNQDVAMGGLDYSLPAVQDYVRSRFGAMRGHIDGLMVDYCDDLWMMTMRGHGAEPRLGRTVWETIPANAQKVEFADKHMTATAFYRTFFRCVKEGLGPNSWLHERCLCQPNNDLILGIADSQRTEHDSDKISPELVSRSGLRWYKNRVVIAYDMDSKELNGAWKVGGWAGSDQDGRRMMLTMAYVAASRLLTANSFRDLSKDVLHDLSRTFPYPTEPRSARPVDAFTHDGWPRVYDFAVTPDWHQVTLFNNTMPTREETISVPLSGDTADGALGLDPNTEYYVYDFWNNRFAGRLKGSDKLSQTLRPGEARMLSVRKVEKHPQVLSTDRHIMQGYYELSDVKWSRGKLSGKAKVVAGEPLKIVIACNGMTPVDMPVTDGLAVLSVESAGNQTVKWSVRFKEPGSTPANGQAEPGAVDLASDTAWTLRCDDGPARPIKVPGGGWNSDQQSPQIPSAAVKDHVVYERLITIPGKVTNQAVKILFGGCNYGAEVWLDDKKVTDYTGPMTPFEADLTGVAVPGHTHRLRVKAYSRMHYGNPPALPVPFDFNKDVPGVSKEYNGHTKFAYGLIGSVRLVTLPEIYVADIFVKPSVAREQLACDVWIANNSRVNRHIQLQAAFSPWKGKRWSYPSIPHREIEIPAGQTVKIALADIPWKLGPDSYWWPNIPFREDYVATLHWLNLTLREAGRTIARRSQRFGFVEHAEGPFYYTVNGVRYTSFGETISYGQVGEYDCWTETPCFQAPHGDVKGCPETWKRYQRIGFNSMRLSTSVPTETMLATADEAGYMLIPEGGSWGNGTATFDRQNFARQLQATIRATRNHPCVSRYSICNEPREPRNANWCWRDTIDDAREADDIRPLVMEVHNTGGGRVESRIGSAHAWVMEHYADPSQAANVKSGIRGMGECAWGTDDMEQFARQALTMRLNDWAHFAPWSWVNYWPNFLAGLNHDRHPWKFNNHADRTDGVDGWGSPVVRLVQRSLHPYLIQNVTAPSPEAVTGQSVKHSIEVFNGGLSGNVLILSWSAHWDKPDGPVAITGDKIRCEIKPGFHAAQTITFTVPVFGKKERKLFLVMESYKEGKVVFREDRVLLNIRTQP